MFFHKHRAKRFVSNFIFVVSVAICGAQSDNSFAQLTIADDETQKIIFDYNVPMNPAEQPDPLSGETLDELEIPEQSREEFITYINASNPQQEVPELILPNADDLLHFAELFADKGPEALAEFELFKSILTPSYLKSEECGTFLPIMLLSLARQIDPEQSSSLFEQVKDILTSQTDDEIFIETRLGENWQLDFSDVPELEEQELEDVMPNGEEERQEQETVGPNSGLVIGGVSTQPTTGSFDPSKGVVATPKPGFDPNLFWITEARPKTGGDAGRGYGSVLEGRCQSMQRRGISPETWLKYEPFPQITVQYKLCGGDGVSEDTFELRSNKAYRMPDGTLVKLADCKTYSKTCAPQHVMMIAEDIKYQRQLLSKYGFSMPPHWNVVVHGENNYTYVDRDGVKRRAWDLPRSRRSSTFLGYINLYGPAYYRTGMRRLTFHEYFHAIETVYRSEVSWLAAGVTAAQFGGRESGFPESSEWWSQLESLASWSEFTVGNAIYPRYEEGNVPDARNAAFRTVYHPLEWGYLAERLSNRGNKKPDLCLGCDAMANYLKRLGAEPFGLNWLSADLHVRDELAVRRLNWTRVMKDYHLDLLYSGINNKFGSRSGSFRFFNRLAPKNSLEPWPPRFQRIPDGMSPGMGECSSTKPLKKSNAYDAKQNYVQAFTCDVKMSPRGAVYFSLPFDPKDLPDNLYLRGLGVKLVPDDINTNSYPKGLKNYRTLRGQLIEGHLQIHAVKAVVDEKQPWDYEKTKAIYAYENGEFENSLTIKRIAELSPTANRMFIMARYPYPFAEWFLFTRYSHPAHQKENFMARIVVVAYWDK